IFARAGARQRQGASPEQQDEQGRGTRQTAAHGAESIARPGRTSARGGGGGDQEVDLGGPPRAGPPRVPTGRRPRPPPARGYVERAPSQARISPGPREVRLPGP